MTGPKTQKNGADVDKFLAGIADEQKHTDCLSVLELMKRALARAGMDATGFSTHSLRRGFANHAIAHQADVRDLMDWVKWKDIRSAVAYLEANQRLANDLAEKEAQPLSVSHDIGPSGAMGSGIASHSDGSPFIKNAGNRSI